PKWSNGLHECGVNKCTCCITCCLPCITHGQIAEVLDERKSSCCRQGCLHFLLMGFHCHWVLSCRIYRRKLRAKFGLPAEPCGDCCVHFCCESCAHAELKNRGMDPSIGF
ncbi:hypothetical protein ACB092_02G104100, partial [Castanea dentata]